MGFAPTVKDEEVKVNLSSSKARKAGLMKFIGGGLFTGYFLWSTLEKYPGFKINGDPRAVFTIAIPLAFTLVGIFEIVTGVQFARLAHKWNGLKGWQRGIFGTAIVLVILFAIIFTMALVME